MGSIRNDVTKQNGGCSVGTHVCAPMEVIEVSGDSEVIEGIEMDCTAGMIIYSDCTRTSVFFVTFQVLLL